MLVVQTLHVHRSTYPRVLIKKTPQQLPLPSAGRSHFPPFPYTYNTCRLPLNLNHCHHSSVMACLPLARQSPPAISGFWSSTAFSVGGHPSGDGLGNGSLFVHFARVDCSAFSPAKVVSPRACSICQHHQVNDLH